jgi:hypothetical protein
MNIWCFSCTAMVVGFLREAAWQSTPNVFENHRRAAA